MRQSQRSRLQSKLSRALDDLADARHRAAEGFVGDLRHDTAARAVADAERVVEEARQKLVALNVRQYGLPTAALGGDSGRFTRPNPAWIVGAPAGINDRTREGLLAMTIRQARREVSQIRRGQRKLLVRQWVEDTHVAPDQDGRMDRSGLAKASPLKRRRWERRPGLLWYERL